VHRRQFASMKMRHPSQRRELHIDTYHACRRQPGHLATLRIAERLNLIG
jgi:hypothetical protein